MTTDTQPQTGNNHNLWQTLILLALIGVGLAFVPWSKLSRPSENAVREALKARAMDYATLRKNDDWEALYELVAPSHRRIIDKVAFLKFYGHGMIDTIDMELTFVDYTKGLEHGKTKFNIKSSIRPEKLPPSQRRSLQYDKPEDLIQTGDLEVLWQRHGGTWYFYLDDEVVSGQARGEEIRGAFEPIPDKPRPVDPTALKQQKPKDD